MRRDLGAPPVAPAALRADRLRIGAELLRPGHEAVGFAEGVGGRSVAAEVDLLAMPGEQRAASQQASVAVAPGAREDDFADRGRQDRLEVPAIGKAHRKRIELGGRDDMVRDQPVFGDSARPARGVEAEQPHEAARRGRERAGWHPGDGDAGFQPVILLQGFERRVDRGGRPGEQRLAPDGERAAIEKGLADLRRCVRPLGEQIDRRAQAPGRDPRRRASPRASAGPAGGSRRWASTGAHRSAGRAASLRAGLRTAPSPGTAPQGDGGATATGRERRCRPAQRRPGLRGW